MVKVLKDRSKLEPLIGADDNPKTGVGDWFRSRFGLPASRNDASWRSLSSSESAGSTPPQPPARRLKLLGPPHFLTYHLYSHVQAILAAHEEGSVKFEVDVATSLTRAQTSRPEEALYLRSDAVGALPILAAFEPEDWPAPDRSQAMALVSGLNRAWGHLPALSIERTLHHPSYLATALAAHLNIRLNAPALDRAKDAFQAMRSDARLYGDPVGYLNGVIFETPGPPASTCRETAEDGSGSLVARTLLTCRSQIVAIAPDASAISCLHGSLAANTHIKLVVPKLDLSNSVLEEIENVQTWDQWLTESSTAANPDAVGLFSMAEEENLVDVLDYLLSRLPEHGLLCGAEPSPGRLKTLMWRAMALARDRGLTFLVEGAEWKAIPRANWAG